MFGGTAKRALVTAAALVATSCGRVPLDAPVESAVPATVDAGRDVAGPDVTDSTPAIVTLNGIWSGQLAVSASGVSWGPFDRLTISFDTNGVMTALQFASGLPPPHIFGPEAPAYPLQGTREVPLIPGSIFQVRVTALVATFTSDHFQVRLHVAGLDGTPNTAYFEDVSGDLVGDVLRVVYTAHGTLLAAAFTADGAGDLRRN